MIASREITSPSTSPPFPTRTWRPARTVPTTVPSIFTTPSALMSPTTRIPVPMMDRPDSDSGAPCPFSVNIAMSILLFYDREGIERLALAADFEMEVRRGGSPGAARERDHLPRHDRVTFADHQPRGVPIHRLISGGVPQEDEQTDRAVRASLCHDACGGCAHRRSCRGRGGGAGVRLRRGGLVPPPPGPGSA